MDKTRKISAVIFDCDGVLFDSRRANTNFYNHLLARFGLSPMEKEKIPFVHMHTVGESVRHIFEGTPHAQAALEYVSRIDFTPFIEDMIQEPGLKELLDTLRPRYGLAVATNRSTTIGEVLRRHGLLEYFDIVVSSLDVSRPKPHPESILKILSFFRIGPEQALYVGDSIVDYETALAAGVCFVSFRNPGLKADYHLERLEEIASVV
jgi:phosphoglycolate phosphatase